MPTTLANALAYNELYDSGFMFNTDGGEAYRTIDIPDNQSDDYLIEFLGYSFLDNDGVMHRQPPEKHPRFPWLFASNFERVQPLGEFSDGGPSGSATYGNISCRVTYTTREYQVKRDDEKRLGVLDELWRYVHKFESLDVESIQVTGGTFVYADDNQPIPEHPGIAIPSALIEYHFFQVPAEQNANGDEMLPAALRTNISNCLSKVNSATFDGVYPPRTLLFLPPEIEPVRMANGKRAFTCRYRFAQRGTQDLTVQDAAETPTTSPNWFRLLRRDAKFYNVVQSNDPTKSIYGEALFSQLFRCF